MPTKNVGTSGVARHRNLVGHKFGKWSLVALQQSWSGLVVLGPPLALPLVGTLL